MKLLLTSIMIVFIGCAEKKVPCDFGTWVIKDSAALFCRVHGNLIVYPTKTDTFQDIVIWRTKDSCIKTIFVDGVKYTAR